MNIFFEVHKDIPREGPGNNESTRRAYNMIKSLADDAKIMDIGCGPGIQTLELGRLTKGKVLAVDMHEPFLKKLNDSVEKEGLDHKVGTKKMDMFNLEVEDGSLDLIWSEGAIFIIGFEKGISEWSRKLKDGGYMAVSEITWIKDDIPQEPKKFWDEGYPQMKSIEDNIKIIEEAGLEYQGHFVIPENAWWDDYYTPLGERVKKFKVEYEGDQEIQNILNSTMEEINLYRDYSDCYGYVFYIMRKK